MSRRSVGVAGAIVAVVYFGAARLGLSLASVHGSVSPVWPATGVAMSALLLGGIRLWPAVTIGAFLANVFTPVPWFVAATIALGNTLEAVVGAWLWRTGLARGGRLGDFRELAAALAASLLAPVASASVGVGALVVADTIRQTSAAQLWVTWWLGDALGALVFVPVVVAAPQFLRRARGAAGRTVGKAALVLALTMGVGGLVLRQPGGDFWLFALFPVLLLATAWFGAPGARLLAGLISVAGIAAAVAGYGPFIGGELNQDLINLQVFLASVAVVALVVPEFSGNGNAWLPILVLLGGWLLSGWMFVLMEREAAGRQEVFFRERVAEAQAAIRVRMAGYIDALRGGASFFAASQSVSRDDWRVYTESLQLDRRYPGINGIGLIFVVPPAEAGAWLARMRADGAPQMEIRPFPNTTGPADDVKYVIAHVEPLARNQASPGRNIATDPSRRRAAELARDTGQPQINRRVAGTRDLARRAGLLLYVPLYAKGAATATVAQRRAAHLGWVYAQFYPDVLLDGVLGPMSGTLRLHFFEHDERPGRERLLYASAAGSGDPSPHFERMTQMELAGQTFQLGWRRGPKFPVVAKAPAVWAATSFAIATLLLAGLVASLQSVGRRALQLATERTAELRASEQRLQAANETLERRVGERTAELAASEERFRLLVEHIRDYAIFMLDPEGRVTTWNNGAEHLKGYTAAEIIGGNFARFFTPEDIAAGKPRHVLATALAHGRCEEEGWRVRKDGARILANCIVTPLRNAAGELLGFVKTMRDITELKRAEAALQASNAELARQKEAVDHHAIVAVTDVRGTITYVNDKFCAISRYSRGELLGQNHRVVNSGHHSRDFFTAMYRTIADGGVWQGEICNRAKDGSRYWVDTTIVPFMGANGKPASYVAIRADITARKQLETSLAAARDQALEASRLKSEFLATMSHEIRTPMNALIGMAGLLGDTPLSTEQAEMVQTIAGGAESLLTIINDILDFSRIEAGQLRLDPEEFDLRNVLEQTVALLAPEAQGKGLKLACEFQSGPLPVLFGDHGRVRQILMNLLGNAIKFTETGEVGVTVATVRATAATMRVRVSVRDTGVGIPPEAQGRLFQPFSQVDGGYTRRFGGTGLGLAISRRLVDLMGGGIGFESKPDRGSTFWFELEFPRRGEVRPGPAPGLEPARKVSAEAGVRRRLLLAEDNLANQRVAVQLLARMGYEVEVAANGQVAISLLGANPFDAALLDCQMPVLDGYAAARRIRAGAAPGVNPRIPIIALTAYARPEDRARCLEAGMDDYVSKPIRPGQLQAALERCGLGRGLPVAASNRAGLPGAPGKGAPAEEVFDPVALEAARSLPGAEGPSLLQELVRTFLSDDAARLVRLARLVETRQARDLALEAHAFGGNAAAFGAAQVRRAAIELEEAAEQRNWPAGSARLADLQRACERLRVEVERHNILTP